MGENNGTSYSVSLTLLHSSKGCQEAAWHCMELEGCGRKRVSKWASAGQQVPEEREYTITETQQQTDRQTRSPQWERERERERGRESEAVDEHACMRGKEEERQVISVISSYCDPTYGQQKPESVTLSFGGLNKGQLCLVLLGLMHCLNTVKIRSDTDES